MLGLVVVLAIGLLANALTFFFVHRILRRINNDLFIVGKLGKVTLEALAKLPAKEEFERVKTLAENAYDITVGLIPDSRIKAVKVGGEVVTMGLPSKG